MPAEPWTLVVVRSWQDDGGLVVRMTLSGRTPRPLVCYETSPAAAGRRLADWLSEASREDGGDAATDGAADAAADGALTHRRRRAP